MKNPEVEEALQANQEAATQAQIDQHRAANPEAAVADFSEAAESQGKIEQDATYAKNRAHHIDRRINDKERIGGSGGRKVSDLNEQARMEVWGSGEGTYTEPKRRPGEEDKRVVASPENPEEGVLEGIRKNSKGFQNDAVFGKGGEARVNKAKEYEEEITRLVEDEGLELTQAKLYMDLGIEADEQTAVRLSEAKALSGKLEAQGNDPEQARARALQKIRKELKGTEAEVHKDRRLEIIKDFGEKGVFTKKEYEAAKKEFVDQGGNLSQPNPPKVQQPNQQPNREPKKEPPTRANNPKPGIEPTEPKPPKHPGKRTLRDRWRDLGVKVVHGGGEKGDFIRGKLKYAALGLIGAGSVIGVNELVDGESTTTLWEISQTTEVTTGEQPSEQSVVHAGNLVADQTSAAGDNVMSAADALTPEKFDVELGNGFTHEITDYAEANGIKDLSPEKAFRIYESLEAQHGSNLIDVLGDSEKNNTYLMDDGNYGIDSPGKAVWAEGVEDTIREELGLPADKPDVDAAAQPDQAQKPETTPATTETQTTTTVEAQQTTGDGDSLAENAALGATGAAVAMGAHYLGEKVGKKSEQERKIDAEKRALELQNTLLEQGQALHFVLSQLPEQERERLIRMWQDEQNKKNKKSK